MLGWLYVGDDTVSLNEQMIEEGYAWAYDGTAKNLKNFVKYEGLKAHIGGLNEFLGIFKMGMGNSRMG